MPIRPRRADAHREPGADRDTREGIQTEQFDAALEQGVESRLREFEHLRRFDLTQAEVVHAGCDPACKLVFERGQSRVGHGLAGLKMALEIILLLV